MLDDQVWRQVPCDIINNPKIRSIAKRFNPMYRQAVFSFYISIYMEADEDGIVDLSDIEVYADQLMIDDEEVIIDLIDRFTQKGYITQLKDGRYFIDDFTNPNQYTTYNGHKVYETADERRARITNTLNGQKKTKKNNPSKTEKTEEAESYPQAEAEKSETQKKFDFSATKSEKASQTLKKEIHTEIKKDTHTQEKIDAREEKNTTAEKQPETEVKTIEAEIVNTENNTVTNELAEQAASEESFESAENETKQDLLLQDRNKAQSSWTVADSKREQRELNIPDNVASRLTGLRSQNDWKTAQVLYQFFKRHDAFIVNSDLQLAILQLLILDIDGFSEPKNPPYIIAGQLCMQFENLVGQKGAFASGFEYFKSMLLTPKQMRSPSVWPRIVAEVKRTLSPGKNSEQNWERTLNTWAEEMRTEHTIYGNPKFFDGEMQKKGINPSDKGAMMAFLAKISAEQRLRKRE